VSVPRGAGDGADLPRGRRRAFGIVVSVVLSSWLASPVEAIDGFALQKGSRGFWHLVMPSEAAEVLRDSARGFEPWPDSAYSRNLRDRFPYDEHTSPFAIVRDLNQDGREDIVLDGWWETSRGVLVLISEGSRYRIVGGPGVGWGPGRVRLQSKPRFSPGNGLRVSRGPDGGFDWAPWSEFDHGFRWSKETGLQSWISD
jgi:hypothetical protein